MQFGLSEEQRMLQSSLARFLGERASIDTVRAAVAGDLQPPRALYAGLADLGIHGLLIPHNFGGLGLGMLDAAVAAQALGTFVAPVPFVAPLVMAPIAIRLGASAEQQNEWLPEIATGERRFAMAMTESTGVRTSDSIEFKAGRINGQSQFVLETTDATDCLVADRERVFHRVSLDQEGVSLTPLVTVDRTRTFAIVEFDNVVAETLAGSNDRSVCARTVAAGRLTLAADTLGAAQAMLDRAVAYAKERKQFERVIGSFQAVKHMCAEMAAQLEPCQALLWHAAFAHDDLPDEAALLACHAHAHVAEVGKFVARVSTEVHGGMGFTDVLGLHFWFKRIGVNRQALGGPERARDEAARLQGWISE